MATYKLVQTAQVVSGPRIFSQTHKNRGLEKFISAELKVRVTLENGEQVDTAIYLNPFASEDPAKREAAFARMSEALSYLKQQQDAGSTPLELPVAQMDGGRYLHNLGNGKFEMRDSRPEWVPYFVRIEDVTSALEEMNKAFEADKAKAAAAPARPTLPPRPRPVAG